MITSNCPKCEGFGYEWFDDVQMDCNNCKGSGEIEIGPDKIVFVNVYSITRHFGGHEEGGWWYNWDKCIETYPVRNKNSELIQEQLEKEYEKLKHGDIYSVLGGTDIDVRIEERPKESETKERPYYE